MSPSRSPIARRASWSRCERRSGVTGELALAAFAAETGRHVLSEPSDVRYARFCRRFDEAAFRVRLAAAGMRWLGRSDPAFPSSLRSIFDPPVGLFLRGGGDAALLERPAVAIVGARACSSYGSHVARTFGRELAAAGLVVVSGMARGVDGEAHRGALDAGGVTVAVLGCGVDRNYPAAHAELARRICGSGLVVSEYAPGVEPSPWRFPARNRIVAGLAQATVVVEAREKSGALITADLALEEGREVFAVPGEITSALSAGTNALLRLGATAATSAADVLESFGLVPAGTARHRPSPRPPRRCSRASATARPPPTSSRARSGSTPARWRPLWRSSSYTNSLRKLQGSIERRRDHEVMRAVAIAALLLAVAVPAAAAPVPPRTSRTRTAGSSRSRWTGHALAYAVKGGSTCTRVFAWNVLTRQRRERQRPGHVRGRFDQHRRRRHARSPSRGHASPGSSTWAGTRESADSCTRPRSRAAGEGWSPTCFAPATSTASLTGGWIGGLVGSGDRIAVNQLHHERDRNDRDRQLSSASTRQPTTIAAGKGTLSAASLDLHRIAVLRSDGKVALYDTETGRLLLTVDAELGARGRTAARTTSSS